MKLKLLFALLMVQVGFAQQRTCGMKEQMQRIMADPILKQQYMEQQAKFEIELAKIKGEQNANKNANEVNDVNVVVRIPVAVHYPSSAAANATLKTCLRTFAQNQINILNADYNAANADISIWNNEAAAFFPGVSVGNMQVQFVIATQNHPAGTGLVNGDLAVTFGTDYLSGADNDATWSGYFNLVVRNINGGILGYSPLGGSLAAGATVVIDNNAFGSGAGCTGYAPGAPYNLGRTLTHELGHFFNLYHTFEACDSGSCATSGDRVCDTPSADTPWFTCDAPDFVSTNCGTTQLTMNYMDYVEDVCMYMFTLGQEQRMRAWYNSVASLVRNNVLSNDSFVKNNFSIFPNPNKGSFTIKFKDLTNDYGIEVFDVTGRVVYENYYNSSANLEQNVTIDHPTSGVYFVNIKSGDVIVTEKIVVE